MDYKKQIFHDTIEYVKAAKLDALPRDFPIWHRDRYRFITVTVRRSGDMYAITARVIGGSLYHVVTDAALDMAYEKFAHWFIGVAGEDL